MKEVTSSHSCAFDASCRRECERVSFASSGIIPNQSCMCKVFCGLETCNLHSICIPSTPSHWLNCSRRRSSFLRIMTYVRTSLSSLMVPLLNSVVFCCKTTMCSCLSGTTCSHVVAEPTHVLELAIVVHFPRISQRHLVDVCCKLSFFFLDSMSLEYPDTNQIWISGRCDGWDVLPRAIILVSR